MKTYKEGSGGVDPLISTLNGGEWSSAESRRFIRGQEPLVPTNWAPGLVWKRWKREKNVLVRSIEFRFLDCLTG